MYFGSVKNDYYHGLGVLKKTKNDVLYIYTGNFREGLVHGHATLFKTSY